MQNLGLPVSSQADGRWGSGPEQAWEAQGPLPLHVLPPVGSLDHPKATASLGSGGRPGPSENLLEQFHIGATLTGSAQADYRSTMEQFGNWETPMHVPQSFPLQVGAAPVPNCPPPAESVMWIDKRQNPHPADVQAEHQRIFGEMAQNLKQQGFHGEYYQQVVTEIAKQLPGVDASLERGYTGPMLPPVAPPPVVPPVVPPVAASPVAPLAPPKNLDGAAPGSSRSREWSPRDPRAEERMEELHRYIRNQANDFAEGKAEWSRQLAEVRSESLREVEKVRREKAELECQARRELARLKHRIKELGGGEEGFSLRALPSDPSEQLAPWAAMVGFEEHQQVQKRCAAAEDRIQELEQYIKASRQESESMESSKEEVPKLRQTVHMLQQELQQAAAELQALRVHHQQKVSFWEQGARRLLGFADQFFSLNGCAPFGSGNEATSGQTRFEKTATKVLVTMPSTDQDGNDVAALQRMLKDVLKNPPKEAAKKAAKEKTGSEGEGEPEEAGNAEDPAPRDEEVHSYGGASCKVIRPPNGKQGDSASDEVPELAETAKIAHFVAQFAVDLKHLLTASNQVLAPPQASLPVASALAGITEQGGGSAENPGGVQTDAAVAAAMSAGERAEMLRRTIEDLAPARRGATERILAAERALRCLERDLRARCQELLGVEELSTPDGIEQEVLARLPLDEKSQLQSLGALRQAQLSSNQALAEFVQLPQKLKVVFDLTKRLSSEVEAQSGYALQKA